MKDTDSDWAQIATHEPYFGVLTDPAFLTSNLTEEALARFWASGLPDIQWQLDILRAHYGAFEPDVALDFGCGVGRLTRVMATIANTVHGIDVAPAMLDIARQGAPANVSYASEIPDVELDWINSLIVFQHIHPRRGAQIISELVARLRPGGAITLHVTIGRDVSACLPQEDGVAIIGWNGESYRPLRFAPPSTGGMTMYDYDLSEIMIILHQAGIHRVTTQYTKHGAHYGVVLIGKKG